MEDRDDHGQSEVSEVKIMKTKIKATMLAMLMSLVMVFGMILIVGEPTYAEATEVNLPAGSYHLIENGKLYNNHTYEVVEFSEADRMKTTDGDISIDLNGKTLACAGIDVKGNVLLYGDTCGGDIYISGSGEGAGITAGVGKNIVLRNICGTDENEDEYMAIILGYKPIQQYYSGSVSIINSNVIVMTDSAHNSSEYDRPLIWADFNVEISGTSTVIANAGMRGVSPIEAGAGNIKMEFPLEAYYTNDDYTYLEKCVLDKDKHRFLRKNGEEPNHIIIMKSSVVKFDANGGSVSPAAATLETNGKLASLPTPTLSGREFLGWYDSKTGGNRITANTVFNAEETTVYARWGKQIAMVSIPKGQTVTYDGKQKMNLTPAGCPYTLSGTTKATKAGTYTMKATLKTNTNYAYKWSDGTTTPKTIKWTINKAGNPLTVKGKTATVKYSAVKKKAQVLAVGKVITFTRKGQGKMTYSKASGNKKIVINKTTGKVTVKKGLKKGTYKVKVKVKAAGNANYKASAWKTVTFTIKIR